MTADRTLTSEMSLADLASTLRAWKLWGVAFVVACTAIVLIASIVLPKKFQAAVLLMPVSSNSYGSLSGGSSNGMSQLGTLASLAGVASTGDTNKAESVATLQSDVLTKRYIQENKLLEVLLPNTPAATLWKANQLFKKKIAVVSTDAKSGLVTFSITWTDAQMAADWANGLVHLTNSYRRDRAIKESETNIQYLSSEVAKTDVVGVRQVIYGIMQSEISKVMLARGNEEFALRIIDPAVPPEKAVSPRPVLWTIGAFVGSITLLIGAAFLRVALFETK